jgi:hypothetical protein
MKITFLGTGSAEGNCPTLYATDRGTIVIQGQQVTDPEALSQLRDVLGGETFVEVPVELGKYWPNGAQSTGSEA